MDCRSARFRTFTGLVALMFATLLMVCAPQAFAAELQTAEVQIGEISTSGLVIDKMIHRFADTTSGTVKWNATTKTVTMTDAVIDLDKQFGLDELDGIKVNGAAVSPRPTVTLELKGTNKIVGNSSKVVSAVHIANANLKIIGPGTLEVQTPNAINSVYAQGSLTAASGSLSVTGGQGGILCGAMTLAGGNVSVKNTRYIAAYATGGMTLEAGSLSIDGAGGNGICSKGDLLISGASVSVANITEGFPSVCSEDGAVTMSAGSLKIAKCNMGISCAKAFTLNGANAKVSMSSLSNYGVNSYGFACESGSFAVSGCKQGIYSTGDVRVTGGTVKVSKASDMGVYAYTGKIRISKGSVSALCTSASKYALYASKGISNKAVCLKRVKGVLGQGATFVANDNTYKATKYSNRVTLKSYGSAKKKVSVNKVKYGASNYYVVGIGSKAFNTERGKAVTSVVLGFRVTTIGSKAFYGTSALTSLKVNRSSALEWHLNKKAFTKCGKNSGKSLKVRCKRSTDAASLKKLFVKAGMSKKATFA